MYVILSMISLLSPQLCCSSYGIACIASYCYLLTVVVIYCACATDCNFHTVAILYCVSFSVCAWPCARLCMLGGDQVLQSFLEGLRTRGWAPPLIIQFEAKLMK